MPQGPVWKPNHTRQKNAEDIQIGEIIQSNLGFWFTITSRDIDRGEGRVEWDGRNKDDGRISPLRARIGDQRIVGWQ